MKTQRHQPVGKEAAQAGRPCPALVEKAADLVLEDAAYRELCYEGPVRPSVWSFDPSGETVILAQTFSRVFPRPARGLRRRA